MPGSSLGRHLESGVDPGNEVDFVSRSIRLLKTNKAFCLDKISARLLKDSADGITPSLTNLQINIVKYLHECELQ